MANEPRQKPGLRRSWTLGPGKPLAASSSAIKAMPPSKNWPSCWNSGEKSDNYITKQLALGQQVTEWLAVEQTNGTLCGAGLPKNFKAAG